MEQWVAVFLLVVACMGVSFARDRLEAVAVLGVVGFLVATFYVVRGPPDLVLAQLLVETLTVAIIVFFFRHLPREFPSSSRRRQTGSALIAAEIGVLAGAATI